MVWIVKFPSIEAQNNVLNLLDYFIFIPILLTQLLGEFGFCEQAKYQKFRQEWPSILHHYLPGYEFNQGYLAA